MLNKILFLFILILFEKNVNSQSPYYTQFSTENGFPANTVYAIYEDENGILWFTTDIGIVIYDSKNYKIYNTDNGTTDNEVFKMLVDHKGRKWVSTLNGKPFYIHNNKIYNDKNSALVKSLCGTSFIYDLYQDEGKNVYFVYRDNLIAVLSKEDEVSKIHTNTKNLFGIYVKNEEKILISANVYNLNKNEPVKPLDKYVKINKIIHSDSLDYIIYNNTIYLVGNNKNQFFKLLSIPEENEIINVFKENERIFWVCTREGLYQYENFKLKNIFFQNYTITCLHKDFENGYWLSTLKNGVFYLNSFDIKLDLIEKLKPVKLNCLSISPKKEIWLGGDANNFYKKNIDDSFFKKYDLNIGKRTDLISNIRFFEDNTYILGKLGVSVVNKNNEVKSVPFSATDLLITNNSTYIGYTKTYKMHTNNVFEIVPDEIYYNAFLNKRCNVFCKDKMENIWIGTNYGLYENNSKDSVIFWGIKNELFNTSIEDILFDEESNQLIFASNSKGIIIMKEKLVIQHFSFEYGLNHNSCICIKKIGFKKYLIGSNNGLNLLEFVNKKYQLKNLNPLLGTRNKKINGIEKLNNTIYLATNEGLIYFEQSKINELVVPPKCHILKLENQHIALENKQLQNISYQNNVISIEYIGVTHTGKGAVTYFYKLYNTDNWTSTKETRINYNLLPPGNYSFQVFCKNELGIKSNMQHFEFTILPPFWQSWWFRILVLCLFIALIYFLIWYRIKKIQQNYKEENLIIEIERDKAYLEKKALELEQKAMRLQMNPHFIFNALNIIKGWFNTGNLDFANNYISKFSLLLRKILENEEQLIPISNEIEIIKLYAELAQLRFENKFDFQIINVNHVKFDEILIPSMLLQPLVENAIIHGILPKKTRGLIQIFFETVGDDLKCTIDDNGIGRTASAKIQEQKIHQSKAMAITKERLAFFDKGNEFKIIDKEEGTQVIISIPIKYSW